MKDKSELGDTRATDAFGLTLAEERVLRRDERDRAKAKKLRRPYISDPGFLGPDRYGNEEIADAAYMIRQKRAKKKDHAPKRPDTGVLCRRPW